MGFHKWDLIGIAKVGDLWTHGAALPYTDRQADFQLAPAEVFRYLQIHHALHKILPKGEDPTESSQLEDNLLTEFMPRKAVSFTYLKLINNSPDTLGSLREHWEHDLGELDDDE
ncbi:hypothetical protein NDU88_007647 [Pleurodeles waltl]|uniref:Uncharacterized protein n=1 Tax=Pleurodeles waltl TaxID=8319 RepID=A0AAV7PLY1_PLEWA|nr:hypothetical protein NDU88_007647 [Pleurodeles waltl]